MPNIVKLYWSLGDKSVAWVAADQRVVKDYSEPVGSAVLLNDGSGIAVVEPSTGPPGRNAVVFNADGSKRFRVEPPMPDRHVAFQQMYYVNGELTAVAMTRGADWAAVCDERSGEVLRSYETR